MKKKKKLKGLKVPRIFIVLLGFIHGIIFKIASIDPDSGYISSGYITEKRRCFNELSNCMVADMVDELKAVRAEASKLMKDEARIRKNIEETALPENGMTVREKRACIEAAKKRAEYTRKYDETVDRLVEIREKINSRQLQCREERDSVSNALQSRFACYGRGMLLKQIPERMIPPVEYEKCFDLYTKNYEEEDLRMDCIVKETEHE